MWPSFEQFVADQYFPGYKIIAPSQVVGTERNLERLRRQLTDVMIRRPKSALNLPPKTREIVEVDIADNQFRSFLRQQWKSLRHLQRQLMTLLDRPATEATRAAIRDLDAKINELTAYVRHQVGMNKLPAVIEYLKEVHWQDPCVCLSPRCHRAIDGGVGGPRGIWVHRKLVAEGS